MALLLFLSAAALTWSLGALHLWPPARRVRELPLWLGGALAAGAAACIAWGFAGVLRQGDWQSLTIDQAVHRDFGPRSLRFQRTGWPQLDHATNLYATLDLVFALVGLSALSLHGHVFWAGVAERRQRARARRR